MLLKHLLTYTCFSLTESENKSYVLKKKKILRITSLINLWEKSSPRRHMNFKKRNRNFPGTPWLRPCVSTAEGTSSVPGWDIRSHMLWWHGQKKKRKIRVKTYILYFRSLNLILISYRREMKLLVF